MIDRKEIGKERENVFDSEQIALLEEVHGLLYVVFAANHMLS